MAASWKGFFSDLFVVDDNMSTRQGLQAPRGNGQLGRSEIGGP
uniref:Uncharacterized protein n=1 Tax=Triticum urartu TaxID=4572 RepID=A0A8R7U252_TRIUA